MEPPHPWLLPCIRFAFGTRGRVWGVEPVVTHQTCWLESTGVCIWAL